MFPLSSVLFPYMPLQLRVFEQRYLTMLSYLLQRDPAEFGVVLIERGQEVGGEKQQRFSTGTVARITQLEAAEGFLSVVAEGERRIEVTEWLEGAAYPRAAVRVREPLVWDEGLRPLRERAEKVVRRALALASEYGDQRWSATVELSEEPVPAAWQLAAIAPLGPLDQVALLASDSMKELLESVIERSIAAADGFSAGAGPLDDLDWSAELGD